MLLWDGTLVILIPAVLLALYAQLRVSAAFGKYSKVAVRSGVSGAEAAQYILRYEAQVEPATAPVALAVGIEPVGGNLTDHYDPRKNILRLSEPVYGGRSLAAVGVAAHEAGHAIQRASGYAPLALRAVLVPAATAQQLTWVLFIIGLFAHLPILQNIAIWVFVGAVAFTAITLPVEFNASARAVALLRSSGLVAEDEIGGVRAVLNAAALTYVAAALMAVLQLLRMLMLRDRD